MLEKISVTARKMFVRATAELRTLDKSKNNHLIKCHILDYPTSNRIGDPRVSFKGSGKFWDNFTRSIFWKTSILALVVHMFMPASLLTVSRRTL